MVREMSERLGRELLERLNQAVSECIGIHFTEDRLGDLEQAFTRLAMEAPYESPVALANKILSSRPSQVDVERLARQITVGETYFFREPKAFKALEEVILPALIEKRKYSRHLKIWSAGCCTGEEVYSVIMLLLRLIGDFGSWKISILATDINPDFIARAKNGIYSEWSFRNALKEQELFSVLADGRRQIDEKLREMVRFSYLNLAEDSYPSMITGTNSCDLILCRNVLIYFKDSVIEKVVDKLSASLSEDGYLLLGATEVPRVSHQRLLSQEYESTYYFRRASREVELSQNYLTNSGRFVTLGSLNKDSDMDEPLIPSPSDRKEAARYKLDYAKKLFRQGDYLSCASLLARYIDCEDYQLTEALELRARALSNVGRFEEALCAVDRVVELETENAYAHYLKAVILEEWGRGEEACEHLKICLSLKGDSVIAEFLLANHYLRDNNKELAASHLLNVRRNLLKLAPGVPLAWSDGTSARELLKIVDGLIV